MDSREPAPPLKPEASEERITQPLRMDRRRWMAVVAGGGMATAGAALIVGLSWPLLSRRPAGSADRFEPNEFLRITPDGVVTVVCGQSEMGQGVLTAFAMLVADELDADWQRVRVEHAPADAVYDNPLQGAQITGGSSSIRGHWQALRRAGASARSMLVQAAAEQWRVDAARCTTENSQVIHPDAKTRMRYGELVDAASRLPVPARPRFKTRAEYRLIGQPIARLDTPAKTNGLALYAIDIRLPEQLVAVVERAPWPNAQAQAFNADAARAIKGVRDVIELPSGIAVLAQGFWAAQRGRALLDVRWRAHPKADEGPARTGPTWSSDTFSTLLRDAVQTDGLVVEEKGLPNELFAQSESRRRVEATYEVPYLAHACMEPMNCMAWVREDSAEVWVGTQDQTRVKRRVAALAGVRSSRVTVNTQLSGGGFGRRYAADMVEDAVRLSRLAGVPVQVIYSREDDMRGGHYRPAAMGRLSASLTPRGLPDVFKATVSVPSVQAAVEGRRAEITQADKAALDGLLRLPYAIGHFRLAHAPCEPGPLAWYWRSVGNSHNLFFLESFIDELALAADQDPMHYRHRLLDAQPRLRGVLEAVADQAGWGSAPSGRFQGIAVGSCNGSHMALVVELSVTQAGLPQVHQIHAAIDCGWVVNPDTVRAQVEGAIVFGLTAALHGQITFAQGRVRQGNFDSYPMLRMADTPPIDIHIVPSTEAPGGVGEIGTPLIAPALANALHAATGVRLRRLPLLGDGPLKLKVA